MRTGLVAAQKRTATGATRAAMPLAGRTVLARQVDLLRMLGCERILCLCDRVDEEILHLQQAVESTGGTFQALRGFLHLPALVRSDDDLVILADGVLPDPVLVASLFAETTPPRFVTAFPAENPLVVLHPDDFERIDAGRHWAGVLAMRGAPVQHLADFPPDADAVSLLLRLALQAGTPCRELPDDRVATESWLLATDEAALTAQEDALITRAAGEADWRRPCQAAARLLARRLAPRGLARGPLIALASALLLLIGGATASAFGVAAAGLGLAAGGTFAAALADALARLQRELLGDGPSERALAWSGRVADGLAALTLWLALAPAPVAEPLAVLGPVVVGLARLASDSVPALALPADRMVLMGALALGAATGVLPLVAAMFALVLLGGLLLRGMPD
jgi:hypothetical protein